MELREAAIAYYNNGPEDLKQRAYDFFKEMDTDKDGKISSFEFMEFLQKAGYSAIQPNFFNELDHDGDGSLDFWEVLTFFYVVKTRKVFCDNCRSLILTGLYFTCVECFECAGGDTYDLCLSCYRQRTFFHSHTVFLDNYIMLLSRRQPPMAPPSNMHPFSSAQPQPQLQLQLHQTQTRGLAAGAQSKRLRFQNAIEGLNIAINAWNLASTFGCSIM